MLTYPEDGGRWAAVPCGWAAVVRGVLGKSFMASSLRALSVHLTDHLAAHLPFIGHGAG
jgi:hypothetical protein